MTLDRLSDAAWRVRLCPSQPGLAFLSVSDHRSTVTPDGLAAAVARARSLGATRVRTSALFDESVPTLTELGFVDIDRLVLLRREIDPLGPPAGSASGNTSNQRRDQNRDQIRLRRLGRWSLPAAAQVDAAAFGQRWATDRAGLADAMAATESSWGRYASARRWSRTIAGFVLCGASATDGYIQRLAVDPSHQRRGVASTLIAASLDWMSNRGSTSVLVNTRPDNHAALTLYERWGFTRLNQELIVAERELP